MNTIYIIIKLKKLSDSSKIKYNTLKLINNIKIIDVSEIPIDSNSIYLFIKHIDYVSKELLIELRTKNNKLIFEPIDYSWNNDNYLNLFTKFQYFDYIICVSENMKKQTKDLFKKEVNNINYSVIYHEYDNRLKIDNKVNDIIYYIGDYKNKSSLNEQDLEKYSIKHIKSCKNKELHLNSYTGIHINYLTKEHIYYNKITSTKLATSMYYNSIFICNRVPIYLEILGENYEYYFEDDLSNLQKIINKAKNTLNNNKEYSDYLIKYSNIKEMFSPEYVKNEYFKLLNTIN